MRSYINHLSFSPVVLWRLLRFATLHTKVLLTDSVHNIPKYLQTLIVLLAAQLCLQGSKDGIVKFLPGFFRVSRRKVDSGPSGLCQPSIFLNSLDFRSAVDLVLALVFRRLICGNRALLLRTWLDVTTHLCPVNLHTSLRAEHPPACTWVVHSLF